MDIIIELFENLITITGNSTVDTVLLAVIGLISFLVSFGAVGVLFDALGMYDSDAMSGAHWIIRVFVFAILSIVIIYIVKFVTWLISFKWWIYLIVFLIAGALIASIYILRYKRKKKINKSTVVIEVVKEKSIEKEGRPVKEKEYNKYLCPRCGNKLVRRMGPYGKFIGCESYPNCNYTRKYF